MTAHLVIQIGLLIIIMCGSVNVALCLYWLKRKAEEEKEEEY